MAGKLRSCKQLEIQPKRHGSYVANYASTPTRAGGYAFRRND